MIGFEIAALVISAFCAVSVAGCFCIDWVPDGSTNVAIPISAYGT